MPAIAACSAFDNATGMSVETYGKDYQEFAGKDPTGYFPPKSIGTSAEGQINAGTMSRQQYSYTLNLGKGLTQDGRFINPPSVSQFFGTNVADGSYYYQPDQNWSFNPDFGVTYQVQGGRVMSTGFQFNK